MKLVIEFTKPAECKPLSAIIRAVDNTPYSHVRLRWVNSVGVDIVYEASGTSIKFLGPIAQQSTPVKVLKSYSFELDREQYRELVKICMTYAGIKYGILQLFGIGLVRLFKLKKNPFADGRRSQVCSELVGRILIEVMGLPFDVNLDIAGPQDIEHFLEKNNGIRI